MSATKPEYKKEAKEMMDSLKEGSVVTGVTIGLYITLKYLFKVSPPSAKLDVSNVGKLGFGIVSGILVKDYAVSQKWINPL